MTNSDPKAVTTVQHGLVAAKLRRIGALIWRVSRKLNKEIIHTCLPLLVRKAGKNIRLERIGSDYGGWFIPIDFIKPEWVCYCIGVGIDATFDMGLAGRLGCRVYSFDPTPKAVAYMARSTYDRDRLTFTPIGVWHEDVQMRFYEPADPRERSNLSIYDLHGTGRYVTADCKRIARIMQEFGHAKIDLLKLDIEGAWRTVVQSIIKDRITPSVFCVELDSPVNLFRVFKVIGGMKKLGLHLVHFEKDNYLFLHESLLNAPAPIAGPVPAGSAT